jgi:hypothetical protein
MAEVRIPSFWVSTGAGIPEVCARHGEPATVRANVSMVSRPAWWAYLLIPFGVLPFILAVRYTRKTVEVAGWPFCARCRTWRRAVLLSGLSIIGAGVVMFAIYVQRADTATGSNPLDWFGVIGLVVAIVGIFVATRATPRATAGAAVSRDGSGIAVPQPHERFAARAAELAAAERDKPPTPSLFPRRTA